MRTTALLLTSALALAAVALPARAQTPVGTAFTYQGVLSENGVPLNGTDVADIEANLYDAASGGNQIGGAAIVYNVDFNQGQFTIQLDFGTSPFAGEARWLELMVRKPPGSGQWVPLSPRQPLTAIPYGLYTLAAGNADLLDSQHGSYYQNAGNLNAGTLADGRLSSNVTLLNSAQTFTGAKSFSTAPNFSAGGTPFTVGATGLVTNLNADLLDSQQGTFYQNAGNLNAGTLADARLSSNAALLNAVQTFTANKYFTGNVGIGYTSPNRMLYVLEDSANIAYPLKLDNPHPTLDASSVGVLFSVGGSGGGPADPDRGKGALVYTYTDTWNRGDFHFLQDTGQNENNPDLADAVMTITNTGNVGIGQTDPTARLHVGGAAKIDGTNTLEFGAGVAGKETNAGKIGYQTWTTDALEIVGAGTSVANRKVKIYANGGTNFTGNVGIGQASPGFPLSFADAAGEKISFYGQSGANTGIGLNATNTVLGIHTQSSGGDIAFGYGSSASMTETMRIKGTGNVGIGIGTATPAARLHVLSSTTGYAIKAEATNTTATGLYAIGGTDGTAADLLGKLRVFHRATNDEVFRAGFSDAGGGAVVMWNADNEQTVQIDADESSTGGRGADISLYNSSGQLTINLDADYGNSDIGRVITDVLEITGGSDLSEQFDVTAPDGTPEPGMVVVIDPENPGQLKLATQAYDRKVAGVISGANGVRPGMLMGQRDTAADGQYPVALTGRVWCWCDASYGAIEPGDLLTTSSTPGHAMRIGDDCAAPRGCVIGKAMTGLATGERGLVLILVSLQ
jgi:hypothetical protein